MKSGPPYRCLCGAKPAVIYDLAAGSPFRDRNSLMTCVNDNNNKINAVSVKVFKISYFFQWICAILSNELTVLWISPLAQTG